MLCCAYKTSYHIKHKLDSQFSGEKRPYLSEMLHPPVNQCHIVPPIHFVKPKHAMLNHSMIKHLAF